MLRHTVAAWPEREAFRQYDYAERRWYSITWRTFHEQVMRWRRAFTRMGLVKGERVAMLLTNCIDAVTFDEAYLRLLTDQKFLIRRYLDQAVLTEEL